MSQLKLIEGLNHVGNTLDSNPHISGKPGKSVLTLAKGLAQDPDKDGFYAECELRVWGRGIELLSLDDRISVEAPNKMKVLTAIEHAIELVCGERYGRRVAMADCIALWERIIDTVRKLNDADKSWTGTLFAYTQGLHTLKDMIRLRDMSRKARKRLVFNVLSLGGPRSVQSISNLSGYTMDAVEDTIEYFMELGFAQEHSKNGYYIIVPKLRCPGKGGQCGKRILKGHDRCYICQLRISFVENKYDDSPEDYDL